MSSAISNLFMAFLVGGTIATGVYAWDARGKLSELRTTAQTCQGSLSECSQARTADRDARERAEKGAAEAIDASRSELAELRAQREEADKRVAAMKSLTDKFRKMIDSGKLQVVLRHGRMVVKLPAGVLFASGSAELSKEGKEALREVAVVLKQVPDRHFMVAGHTDNVPVVPPSPFKNNLELSSSRALVVAEHLVASGMPAGRLVAAAYSEHEPVRENTSEAGRHENRRIEIVLLPNVTELPTGPADAGAARDAGSSDASVPRDASADR